MGRIRVLIVDDSKVSCAVLANIMRQTSYEVCGTAANAADAIEQYRELRPDAVTMDMNLPDMDGIECSRRICQFDPDARIVMISAMRDSSLVASGREAGISSFLQKPVTANDFIDALDYLCQELLRRMGELQKLYVTTFAKALDRALFRLVGVHSAINIDRAEGPHLDIDGIAVIIGLTGKPSGRAIVHMSRATMLNLARAFLNLSATDGLGEETAGDAVEEAANIIVGRGASTVNDLRGAAMRISPPGTIIGEDIRIANFKMTSFLVTATTSLGTINLNLGFAEEG